MTNQIPITVINLKKETNRKNRITSILSKLNLEFSFLEGIHGLELSSNKLKVVYNPINSIEKNMRLLTKNEIGATLSHFKVYRQMLDDNIDEMIVLEDDIVIDKKFIEALNVIEHLPTNWELFLLGYAHGTIESKLCNINIHLKSISTEFNVGIPVKTVMGAFAYVISKKGAKRMLSYRDSIFQAIDLYTGNRHLINVYTISPRVVSVDLDLGSDIHYARIQSRLNNKSRWKKKIRHNKLYKTAQNLNEKRKRSGINFIDCVIRKMVYRIRHLFIKHY